LRRLFFNRGDLPPQSLRFARHFVDPSMTKRFALLLLALLAWPVAQATASPDAPVAGTDYVVIEDGQPYRPLKGRIEVVEVFGYWCIHCAHFQPEIDAWKRKLPRDVRFTYVPAIFHDNDPFARAYFAAERTGALARTHQALFDAVHVQQTLAKNASVDELAAFYAAQGFPAPRMQAAMQDPAVNAQLAHAKAFALRSGVTSTPTLVVNGKYRVGGRTADERLRIAAALVAMERKARP
jgi:thiol:disulfide interchange protein DsbA